MKSVCEYVSVCVAERASGEFQGEAVKPPDRLSQGKAAISSILLLKCRNYICFFPSVARVVPRKSRCSKKLILPL